MYKVYETLGRASIQNVEQSANNKLLGIMKLNKFDVWYMMKRAEPSSDSSTPANRLYMHGVLLAVVFLVYK